MEEDRDWIDYGNIESDLITHFEQTRKKALEVKMGQCEKYVLKNKETGESMLENIRHTLIEFLNSITAKTT